MLISSFTSLGGKVPKKYSRKEKSNEKIFLHAINHKKYSCYGLKKNSYKEFDKEKKFLTHPPPP